MYPIQQPKVSTYLEFLDWGNMKHEMVAAVWYSILSWYLDISGSQSGFKDWFPFFQLVGVVLRVGHKFLGIIVLVYYNFHVNITPINPFLFLGKTIDAETSSSAIEIWYVAIDRL